MKRIILNTILTLFFSTGLFANEFLPSIPVTSSVNQGAFNYNIPLDIPKGINGLKPKLSINYNSQSGDGYLGTGFNLSGLSSISRCAKTIATDGVKGSINFNDDDRACLDGQRLIVVSGKYWEDNSVYQTEINNYSKITYNGEYFKVQTKGGKTLYYGNTNNSKIEANNKTAVREYLLSQVIDNNNNQINYNYIENNSSGEFYIDTITYADNQINFSYESRNTNKQIEYQTSKLQINKRLKTITIKINNQILNTYTLNYQTNTDQIIKITQNTCPVQPSKPLP